MKTIKILFLFVGMLVSSIVYAQSGHRECAPGCISNQAQGKGRVTCIDEVCTICHEKQEKERKEKLEADKLAAQKKAQQAEQRKQQQTKLIADQKKQVAIQRQKAKENELVLVAPTPKVEIKVKNNLSESDIKIKEKSINLDKYESIIIGYCFNSELGSCGLFSKSEPIDNVGKIFLRKFNGKTLEDDFTVLKDNFDIKSKNSYTFFRGVIKWENTKTNVFFKTDYFIISFENENDNQEWNDLVDIQGNCVFNDLNIKLITYDSEYNMFFLTKKGEQYPSQKYNPTTKKTIQIK